MLVGVFAFLLKQYVGALSDIAQLSRECLKVLGIVQGSEDLTALTLLKDIRFFMVLMKKDYMRAEVSVDAQALLSRARLYLGLQYPVAILLFAAPALFY